MGFKLSFDYDSDLLTPVSVGYGDIISGGLQDNIEGDAVPGSFNVYWSSNENLTGNGVLLYVNFQIKPSAAGNTAINISFSQADTFDEDFNDIALNCLPVELHITNTAFSEYAVIHSSVQNATAGDSFSVKLNLAELNTEKSLSLLLDYDESAFEYVSCQSIGVVSLTDNGSSLTITAVPELSQAGKDFITLNFKCRENAKSGTYSFKLSSDTGGIICKSCENTVYASSTSDIAFVGAESSAVIQDGKVNIPIRITNNHGIMGYMLHFSYDSTLLEPIGITASDSINGMTDNNIGLNEGCFDVIWQDSTEFSADGVLFTLSFNVLSDSFAETQVDISYSQEDTFNGKYEDVVFSCSPVTVLKNCLKGDIDEDGDIDIDDYAYLKSYLCGQSGYGLNALQFFAADMNSDGAADAFDMFLLDKKINEAAANLFTYSIISGSDIRITGYTGTETAVTVPSEIDGYTVKNIYNYAFRGNTSIRKVVVSSGITGVGYGAFLNCTALEEVELPDSLKSIGTNAFKGCTNLAKVTIPSSVTSINANSFADCANLKIYGEAGSYAETYASNSSIPFICFSYEIISGKNIKVTGYNGDDSEIVIPAVLNGNNVTAIYNYAFRNNANLQKVTLSSGIKTVGYGAFLNCSALESVELPDGLTSIGTYAFKDCRSLTKVIIPASVSSINANSFTNCNALTIYGYSGSYAETYANTNGISFVAIG